MQLSLLNAVPTDYSNAQDLRLSAEASSVVVISLSAPAILSLASMKHSPSKFVFSMGQELFSVNQPKSAPTEAFRNVSPAMHI
jgi:hypothetical protein